MEMLVRRYNALQSQRDGAKAFASFFRDAADLLLDLEEALQEAAAEEAVAKDKESLKAGEDGK